MFDGDNAVGLGPEQSRGNDCLPSNLWSALGRLYSPEYIDDVRVEREPA